VKGLLARLGELGRRLSGIDAREWKLLALLGSANAVNGYDLGILALALPAIQASLGIAEEHVGVVLAVIRVGMLPALAFGVLADRWGRRSLLLATIVGFTVCTVLTAAVPNAAAFVAVQFIARVFMAAEDMLGIVVVAEEIGAARRGFALGVLAALGGIGHGLAAVSYALVGNGPYGWRLLYLAGALPLVGIAWLRRSLGETRRFSAMQARQHPERIALLAPLRALVREHPRRVLGLAGMVIPVYFVMIPAISFQAKFLQEAHGYSAAVVAFLYFMGGGLSVTTQLLTGLVSDGIGRKPAALLMTVLTATGTLLLYCGNGSWVLAGWLLMVAAYLGLDIMLSALGSELFPTAYRSTASAARSVTANIGATAGLALEGLLFTVTNNHGTAIAWMLLPLLLVPVAVMTLPETAKRELEDIAPG
jgi:putative MFS transporter